MTKNSQSTRFYSRAQEEVVAALLGGNLTPNSGAGKFQKGDIINKDISLLCECKTVTSEKESFSIKKEWLLKNDEERKTMRLENSCIAFSFGPGQQSFYIIDEKLMKFLVKSLKENYMP